MGLWRWIVLFAVLTVFVGCYAIVGAFIGSMMNEHRKR